MGKSNTACQTYPSSVNCRPVIDTINVGDRFLPACQCKGDTVGSNPYWVYGASSHGTSGWILSWWIDNPYDVLPGVPDCGPPSGRAAFEANGGDQWRNLPVSGISGNVGGSAVSAINLNGTRLIYTIR
ncbi:hypothetical protein ACFW6F_31255 [Streptomyces sp. NPDC058746]|uniref:hypothetical protein n=1 Tax=Streptomyces sp. NPDC058746 TaxID=3346622 RepID=UPI00367CACF7